jgi:hypothetical protein
VDHWHGAWYRILSPENGKLSDEKSPAGKTDYHTMGACYDVLRAMGIQLGANAKTTSMTTTADAPGSQLSECPSKTQISSQMAKLDLFRFNS